MMGSDDKSNQNRVEAWMGYECLNASKGNRA